MGRGDHGHAPGLRSGTAPLRRTLRPTYCSMRAWTPLQHQLQTSPKVKVNGKEVNIGYMKFFRPGEKIGLPSLAACTPARRVHACLPREVGFLVRAEPVTQACQLTQVVVLLACLATKMGSPLPTARVWSMSILRPTARARLAPDDPDFHASWSMMMMMPVLRLLRESVRVSRGC
jgi:hypothetical protein